MTNEQGWPVCGHSWHLANLTSSFEVHFAPAEEMEQHGGVCARCAIAFRKRNGAPQDDKHEAPAEMNDKQRDLSLEQDHAAFTSRGVIEPVVDFPFDELDGETAEFFNSTSEDVRRETARALALIMAWIWSSGWQSAQRKFAAFSASLDPSLLDGMTYHEIGERLGCTKAAISKAALVCSQKFHIRWSRSRPDEARRRMAAAQIGHAGRDTSKRSMRAAALDASAPPPV